MLKYIKHLNFFSEYNSDALTFNDLDLFKKANLALRCLSLIKGKGDIVEKWEIKLFKYSKLGIFGIRNLINIQ